MKNDGADEMHKNGQAIYTSGEQLVDLEKYEYLCKCGRLHEKPVVRTREEIVNVFELLRRARKSK